MKGTQRNNLCACGSGKKFKRCHGLAPVNLSGYLRSDRESALQKLDQFSRRAEFENDYKEAMGLFGVDDITDLIEHFKDEEVAALRDSSLLQINAQVFFTLEYCCEPKLSLIDLFLERHGGSEKAKRHLSSAEIRFLEDLRETQLRFYRVIELKSGSGMRLQRMWEDEDEEQDQVAWVDDTELPDQLILGDFFAARLLPTPAGKLECFADLYPFPAATETSVLDELEFLRLEVSRKHSETSRRDYMWLYPYNVQRAWLYALFGERIDVLDAISQGSTDDLLERMEVTVCHPIDLTYSLRDKDEVRRAFQAHDEFDSTQADHWMWLRKSPNARPEDPAELIALMKIEGQELIAQAMQPEYRDDVSELIEQQLGSHVHFLREGPSPESSDGPLHHLTLKKPQA